MSRLLHLVMPCFVDFTTSPALFLRETEEHWIWGRVGVSVGGNWSEGRLQSDIVYERKMDKN